MEQKELTKQISEKINEFEIPSNTDNNNNSTEFEGIILYRRKMGKKLCAITIMNETLNQVTGAIIHDEETIKKIKIGDIVKVKGKIFYHKNVNKNIEVEDICFLGSSSDKKYLNKKRQIYIDNKEKLTDYDCLCSSIKKGLTCNNKNCKFRHEIKNTEEKEIIIKNKMKKEIAWNSAHEGDPLNHGDKNQKSYRNSEFADFLVKTFGIDNLKKGIILDIAGGKGLLSYYLSTKYKLSCKIIDPRGTIMPKKYIKRMKELGVEIPEERRIFNVNTCDDLIKNCVLIIGMHPDEATVDIVDVALKHKINFAIVPCCVFHNKFPDRKLKNGKEVVEYNDICQFILEKDDNLKIDFLNIKGRNKVIFKVF